MRKRRTERALQRAAEMLVDSPQGTSVADDDERSMDCASVLSSGSVVHGNESETSFKLVDCFLWNLAQQQKQNLARDSGWKLWTQQLTSAVGSSAAESKLPSFDARSFNHAKLKTSDLSQLKFWWQKGHLKNFFGKTEDVPGVGHHLSISNASSFRLRVNVAEDTKVSAEVADAPMSEIAGCIYAKVIRSFEDIGYREAREAKRFLGVSNWWKLLATKLRASEIGLKVDAEAPRGQWAEYGKEVIDACFGVKSPNTLIKRYCSVNSFVEWCADEHDSDWLPLDERLAAGVVVCAAPSSDTSSTD